MAKNFLRASLAWESRAYGFTIAFWGSGALLIRSAGPPTLVEAVAYGGGAILGFLLLTIYAYRDTLDPVNYEEPRHLILSMVHYIASLVPIIAAYFFRELQSPYSFILTGLSVTLLYNMGMIVEANLANDAERLEEIFFKR
ncbi:MAG: hypothetical protein ABEJ99_04735 [Candidatus Nanohaloarchaea archaeon]